MRWRRAEESNPHPGLPRRAGFRDQKALPSLRALRWNGSRDSNPVRAVLQTAASSAWASPTWHTREELNLESQFWRLLSSPSGRVRGTPGRSRTCRLTLVLSEPRLPIPPREYSLVGRGRLELPCTRRLVLSEVCLPDSTTGPVSRAGLEPARLQLSTAGVYQLRHLDILVRAVGLEPTKPLWATGLRPVSFATHSRAHKLRLSKNLAESRGLEPRCAEATES